MLTELLPPLNLFLSFMAAGIALNLTPGSDMAFAALSGARGGVSAALAAAAGVFTGCLGHILFAVAGVSAIIAASQTAFAVLKWLGVVYLLYLAWQMVRRQPPRQSDETVAVALKPSMAFRQAMLINVLNPKVGIFFLAFLPQFIDPAVARPWLQILVLGLVFNTTGTLINGAVGILSAKGAENFQQSEQLGRLARWVAATVLGGLALKLALMDNDLST